MTHVPESGYFELETAVATANDLDFKVKNEVEIKMCDKNGLARGL